MIESPMNYTGSKYKLLDQILPKFYKTNKIVDLFSGGGSVYLNVLNQYNEIQVNDIISDLVSIHQQLLTSDDIIHKTKELCPGKNNAVGYGLLRDSYNESPTPDKLWALMLSCTNNMMRFNQKFKFNQTYGNRGWNPKTDEKVNKMVSESRPYRDKIKFTSKPFQDIEITTNTFYYCDPPYGRIKDINGNIGKKQISEAGYNCYWKENDDIDLYHFLHQIDQIGSYFMVSGVLEHNGNICWMLDKLINDGFKVQVLNHNYNKVSKIGDKITKEVIIMNY